MFSKKSDTSQQANNLKWVSLYVCLSQKYATKKHKVVITIIFKYTGVAQTRQMVGNLNYQPRNRIKRRAQNWSSECILKCSVISVILGPPLAHLYTLFVFTIELLSYY